MIGILDFVENLYAPVLLSCYLSDAFIF